MQFPTMAPMKTGRRSFLKAAGAFLGGLAVVGAKASDGPTKFQRVVWKRGYSKKKGTELVAGPHITVVLDLPKQEMRIKGLYRAEDCKLRTLDFTRPDTGNWCEELVAEDGTVINTVVPTIRQGFR